ncbi:hypothetical protein BDR07DRAFT_1391630, partial [Suillus spraguei]
TGVVLSILKGSESPVFRVAFSPYGPKLASGTQSKIQVWNTDNPKLPILDINAHNDWVHIAWSPDGQQIVSASEDKTVKFWDSLNGTLIGGPWTGHTNDINSLAISSDGSFIATASDDKTVCLWSIKQMAQPLKLEHTALVFCVAFSHSGEWLATGDSSGNLQLWSIEDPLSAAFGLDSSYFIHRSEVRLNQNLYEGALLDADKVIGLNPSSHLGYNLRHAALCGLHRHDDASKAFETMLSRLNDAPEPQMRELYSRYEAIKQAIDAQLKNAPLRLINTRTGRLCSRDARINTFMNSTECNELLLSLDMPLQPKLIEEVVAKYFGWVMLSHRWGSKEPLLHDIQDRDIYTLDSNSLGTVKLQKFCEVARNAGHYWAWSDTCCIDQKNNAELGESVNSMFIWYRYSALTIVYLLDVPPSSESGALANSVWNTRGWTVQEFLAPKIVLFYQADWTLYLDDRSYNHKESDSILKELERSTGINARALKLRWASNRDTTREEDIAYSLFGIFGIHLPVIYGEKRQSALGRLLQYIIAHSGDITALEWVGQSSNFNSCLPAAISSYKTPTCTLPSLSENEMQLLISKLRNNVAMKSASKLYTLLNNLSVPRFFNARLQLPCITFPLTEVRPSQNEAGYFTYDVKADGQQDLPVTTNCNKLLQFPRGRRTQQTFLLIRPWNRHDIELVDSADQSQNLGYWPSEPGDNELVTRGLRLFIRLSQSFGALLLEQQRGGEYKRIASDHSIIAQVGHMTSADNMMEMVKILEIL